MKWILSVEQRGTSFLSLFQPSHPFASIFQIKFLGATAAVKRGEEYLTLVA